MTEIWKLPCPKPGEALVQNHIGEIVHVADGYFWFYNNGKEPRTLITIGTGWAFPKFGAGLGCAGTWIQESPVYRVWHLLIAFEEVPNLETEVAKWQQSLKK